MVPARASCRRTREARRDRMRERADHMGVKCREEEKRGERRGGRPGRVLKGKDGRTRSG